MRKIVFSVLIVLAGCSKEAITDVKTKAINEVPSQLTVSTYLPLTTGTYWSYNNKTGSDVDQSKLTVSGKTKTLFNKNYSVVSLYKDGSYDTVYYNQTSHDYYLCNVSNVDDASVNLEILFLKDDAAVGSTWQQSAGKANGLKLRCFGKILEKNISVTVNGTTYKNVIHSYVEIRKPLGFLYVTVYKQDYYVAYNIGIVKNSSTQLLPLSSTTSSEITSYSIK